MALEGAYAFDDVGSTTVVDLSGNGRDINLSGTNGAQVDSAGLLDDGALGKTGADTIELPASLLTASETDDRTLMCDCLGLRSVWWVRWESVALDTGVWGQLSLDAASIVTRARDQANANPTPFGSTIGALSATVRHNFAMTYVRSTGTVTYYYDGASVGTQAFAPGTALYVGADSLNIAEWSSTGPAIDNLRIYSHALTALEVAAIAGTPVAAAGVDGTATVALGGLTTTAAGTRTSNGVTTANLGALASSASGIRDMTGVSSSTLAGPTTLATGSRSVVSTVAANVGPLSTVAIAIRTLTGTALAALGSLIANAVVPGSLPDDRLVTSGREPPTFLAGREPRSSL